MAERDNLEVVDEGEEEEVEGDKPVHIESRTNISDRTKATWINNKRKRGLKNLSLNQHKDQHYNKKRRSPS